jgi:hypothetical protein
MIEVSDIETGDCAEADSPEGALLAARVLGQEAREHVATQGFDPTLRFSVDGVVVRQVTLRTLRREFDYQEVSR